MTITYASMTARPRCLAARLVRAYSGETTRAPRSTKGYCLFPLSLKREAMGGSAISPALAFGRCSAGAVPFRDCRGGVFLAAYTRSKGAYERIHPEIGHVEG